MARSATDVDQSVLSARWVLSSSSGRRAGGAGAKRLRVALLDPDQWRRIGIAAVLSETGVSIVDEGAVDLVLLSRDVLARLGPQEIARVRAEYGAEVIVLDEEHCVDNAARAFGAGARGYFDMSGDPSRLGHAVEVVGGGGVWGPREALVLLSGGVEPAANGDLEPEQREVLACLNEGLTNKEIGQRLGVAEATVKARMNRLYRKFRVTSRVQLLAAAFKRGLFS